MKLTTSIVEQAYLCLKSYAYHENLNLFLKQRLAASEVGEYDKTLSDFTDFLNDENWNENPKFTHWLNDIGYYLLPKVVSRKEDAEQNMHNEKDGLFISNMRSSNQYQVSKVNYFINSPIQLHILEMLWCIVVGPALESKLTSDCYGNRMHESVKSSFDNTAAKTPNEVFKFYIEQYNQWRDQAIKVATEISKKRDDVALLSLDLKSYFYHVDLKFEQIIDLIESYYSGDTDKRNISLKLTQMLEVVFKRYNKKIHQRLKQTNAGCEKKQGLPIGFASSSIIANWYLAQFDDAVADEVRPDYYGRYVDDIIMVFKRPKLDAETPSIKKFVDHYLKKILSNSDDGAGYNIYVDENELPIQKDKLILLHLDKDHSRAILELFRQELDERSSAFKFLPSDHIDVGLDKFSYDVLYRGSANKLRSIVGLAENETELVKYLSNHITAHRLCKLNKKNTVLPQLACFFKGQNALQYSRLWEKVYQYALITSEGSFIDDFFRYLDGEIEKICGMTLEGNIVLDVLTGELRRNLSHYNRLSLAISVGLLDITDPTQDNSDSNGDNFRKAFHSKKSKLGFITKWNSDIHNFAWNFRASNLIRHHLVAWPLANYSNYTGDLTDEATFISESDISLDDNKVNLSPRFIHYDEWQLFDISHNLTSNKSLNRWFKCSLINYKKRNFYEDFPVKFNKISGPKKEIIKAKYSIGKKENTNKIKLAIANLVVSENDIKAALRTDQKPNVSFTRQKNLYQLLNSTIKEKVDILVMPEVAIPVSWLPFMLAFARRHQIAIVFGLEHWVVDNKVAYNLMIEALPFKVSNKYKSCTALARIKNHYAPDELDLINSLRLEAGHESIKPKAYYHKVSWRGVSFSTYNCFELSDITHRVLFRSEIDLLFACVWNKDTNYYQHILESIVRDLHCYTVQVNTSQYGGSCVLRPTKTDSKTMLYVKGGENPSVLTTKVDIAALREFQFRTKPGEKDIFKHLPPGFDNNSVLKR